MFVIHKGQILHIAPQIIVTETDKVIDATGLTLLPEIIDPQVYFREPELEHKEDLHTASCVCANDRVASC